MRKMNHYDWIASCDVDAQNTFTESCPQELPVPKGSEIVGELNQQAQYACYRVGSKDAHSPSAAWLTTENKPILTPIQADNMDCHWPAHAMIGTKGFELITGLPPLSHYDFFVWKGIEPTMHPYGACYHDLAEKLSTGLIEFLIVHGVKLVIVGGLATDYCVKTTVCQLLAKGLAVVVNLAACRGIHPETIEKAIEEMRTKGAYFIASSAELPHLIEEINL